MRLGAIAAAKRRASGICLCALLVLGLSAWLDVGESAAARHCSPVVTGAGPGFTQASVLIVTGRTDCEKSRKVIFKALSTTSYASRLDQRLELREHRPGAARASTAPGARPKVKKAKK